MHPNPIALLNTWIEEEQSMSAQYAQHAVLQLNLSDLCFIATAWMSYLIFGSIWLIITQPSKDDYHLEARIFK